MLILGLCAGSFVTCASYRLPIGIDIVRKPSFCPICNTPLAARDLFPLFSWLFSRGKCRHCQSKISVRYPLIEVITAAIFIFIYERFGMTQSTAILALASVALLIMIVADLEHYIIPDSVHIALLPLALLYRFTSGTFSPEILVGFLLMTGLALLLHYGYSALRGRAMLGYGDVKFFAVSGVWLDAAQIPAFLTIAGALGIVLGIFWKKAGRGEAFPFGPALAVSLFFCIVFPEYTNITHK